ILESDRAQGDAAHVRDSGDGRNNARGAEHLSAACVRRKACGDVERGTEIPSVLLDGGARIDADTDTEKQRLAIHRAPETKRSRYGAAWVVATIRTWSPTRSVRRIPGVSAFDVSSVNRITVLAAAAPPC